MVVDFYSLLIAFARLRSSATPRKWSVFAAYVRIRLKARWLQLTGQKRTTETFLGFNVCFFDYSTFAYLFEEIFIEASYFFHAPNETPKILDAGSNIGISVLYFKWLYPNALIFAFEPDQRTFGLLKENVERNGLKNVVLNQVALSDKDGEAIFHTDREGSLGASLLEARNQAPSEQVVQVRSLVPFLTTQFDFMKMDIEGAESECLTDVATQGRLGLINEMVIECHHNLPGRDRILSRLLPMLEASGFVFQVQASKTTALQPPSSVVAQDVMLHVYQSKIYSTAAPVSYV